MKHFINYLKYAHDQITSCDVVRASSKVKLDDVFFERKDDVPLPESKTQIEKNKHEHFMVVTTL
jgi:hypothetical protein